MISKLFSASFLLLAAILSFIWYRAESGYEPIVVILTLVSGVIGILGTYFYVFGDFFGKVITSPFRSRDFLVGADRMACICFRIDSGNINFLLVRSSSDVRWTFPKCMIDQNISIKRNVAKVLKHEAGVLDFKIDPVFQEKFSNYYGSSTFRVD